MSKLNDQTIKRLEEAFSIGASDEEACFYADITKPTLYEWRKSNKKLSDRFDALKQKPILKARQSVMNGLDGDYNFALKYLERKKRDEFALRTEVENSGNITIKVSDE